VLASALGGTPATTWVALASAEGLRSQDPRDRGPRHTMTQIPKRSLHPCIAPPRVFRRHPENELANLALHAWSAGSPLPAGPLLRDQFAMPAEDRVRCHKSRDVVKRSSADLVSEHSQPPTLVVGESDTTTAQLRL
jgi:hypothetical protein